MRELLESQIAGLNLYIDNRDLFNWNIAIVLNHQYSFLFSEDNRKFLKLTIEEPFDEKDKEIWLDYIIPEITNKLKVRITEEERIESGYHSDDTEATVIYEEASQEPTTFADKELDRKEMGGRDFGPGGR